MNLLEAHAAFCTRPDGGHGLLHPQCDRDTAPVFCTALVALSGQLEGSETQEDLDAALQHAYYLLRENIATPEQYHDEVTEVIEAVAAWGEAAELSL